MDCSGKAFNISSSKLPLPSKIPVSMSLLNNNTFCRDSCKTTLQFFTHHYAIFTFSVICQYLYITPADSGGRVQESIVQQLNILPVADIATWTPDKGSIVADVFASLIKFCTGNETG